MSHTVKVNQRTCGRTTFVTASLCDDGNSLRIDIESDCPNVKEYANRLKDISVDDVVVFEGSKVEDPIVRATLSVPCMVPNGVFNAAWLELGMLSPNTAKRAVSNDNEFVWDGSGQERGRIGRSRPGS